MSSIANAMTERTVLADGCFWGMQELIRKMDSGVSTCVGYTCHFVRQAHVAQP